MICYCFCVMPMSSMSGSELNKIFSQMIYSLLPHLILIEHSGILLILKEDKEKFNFGLTWPHRPVEYPRGLIFISIVRKCASNNFTVSWDFWKKTQSVYNKRVTVLTFRTSTDGARKHFGLYKNANILEISVKWIANNLYLKLFDIKIEVFQIHISSQFTDDYMRWITSCHRTLGIAFTV